MVCRNRPLDRSGQRLGFTCGRLHRALVGLVACGCLVSWCATSNAAAAATSIWSKQRTIQFDPSDLTAPADVAVDWFGDVFAVGPLESCTSSLACLAPAAAEHRALSSTTTPLPPPPLSILGSVASKITVDLRGDLYLADWFDGLVLELPAKGTAWQNLPITLNSDPQADPWNLATDWKGNVFVADGPSVIELPAGGKPQVTLPFTNLSSTDYVGVDSNDDVFVADAGQNKVLELPAGSSTEEVLPFSGLNSISDIAVDQHGDVYVLEGGVLFGSTGSVVELPAGGYQPIPVPFSIPGEATAIAVRGNSVYLTDYESGEELELTHQS